MVLVPLVVFGGAGLYFDRRFDSLPQLLLAGIGISFIVTIYWMSSRLKYIVAALLKEHK